MSPRKTRKPSRKLTAKETEKTCLECSAICCKDLAVMITRPRSKEDIEELKWQLHFDTVKVFIRNHRWHVLTRGRCIYLNRRNLCDIYERRSDKCREHAPPDCERFGEYYDVMISTPEELERHLKRAG